MNDQDDQGFEPEPVEIPITSELDLHFFRPSDLGILLPEYFRECRKRGILEVRVVHGKGTGALRQGVIKLLERLPSVASYRTGGADLGSWGATIAKLNPWGSCDDDADANSQL